MTQDKTWVHHFDPFKNAEQAMEVHWLTTPKKFERVPSAGKVMVSIFLDSQGVIMIDYLEKGYTINLTIILMTICLTIYPRKLTY